MGVPIKAIENLPVMDAKTNLTITITQKDIDKADVKHPEGCAAARACVREHHALEARVHLSRVYTKTTKGNWTRYLTSPALRSEIIAFDRGGTFAPGTYTLIKPQPAKTLGKQRGTNTRPKERGKKRRAYHVITDVRNGPA